MKLEEITTKLEEAGIDSGVITAVKGLDNSAEVERLNKELTAEQGKSASILEDKKRYKSERDAHKTALDKIENDKLPEEEKHKKALEEMQAKLETEKAEREQQAAEYAKAQRDAKVSDLAASIKWIDGTPQGTGKLIVQNALAGVDDLSDKEKVGEAIKGVTESHKAMIAATAPAGSGDKSGGGGGGNQEPAPSIAENQKALWGAQ